jgi:hypothetical protein
MCKNNEYNIFDNIDYDIVDEIDILEVDDEDKEESNQNINKIETPIPLPK